MTEREVESRCGGCNKVPVEGDGHAEDYCPLIELGDPSTFVNSDQLDELLGLEREVESRNPSVCGYCGNGDIESDGVHTCVNSVPNQARAEWSV